jgi:hypothetical protein
MKNIKSTKIIPLSLNETIAELFAVNYIYYKGIQEKLLEITHYMASNCKCFRCELAPNNPIENFDILWYNINNTRI